MIGLLVASETAVMDNTASANAQRDGIRLSIRPLSNLHTSLHELEVPQAGAYSWGDDLYACGREDGSVVGISEEAFR